MYVLQDVIFSELILELEIILESIRYTCVCVCISMID